MTWFLWCIFLFSTSAFSSEDVSRYEAAQKYLLTIVDQNDFEVSMANHYIDSISPICENAQTEQKFQSRVCLTLSRLHGKLADKLRMKGISNGKSMFRFVKKALLVDPANIVAAIFHAEAVIGVYNEGPIGRRTAAKLLEINLTNEISSAKDNLERLDLTQNPIYQKIVDATYF